jgi:hypothetical protein
MVDVGFTDHQASLLQGANQLNNRVHQRSGVLLVLKECHSFNCANLLTTAQKELLVCLGILLMATAVCGVNLNIQSQANPRSFLSRFSLKLFIGVSVSLGTKVIQASDQSSTKLQSSWSVLCFKALSDIADEALLDLKCSCTGTVLVCDLAWIIGVAFT